MANALMADISGYQSPTIGSAYWGWSSAGDGVSRLIFKATEGVGFEDQHFVGYWQQAAVAHAGMIACYHYARPDLNPGATGAANEAQWFAGMLQGRLGAQDRAMLDFEQNEDRAWAHAFHDALIANRPLANKPVLYDSASHFQQYFAGDLALAAKYDCALASWHPIAQGPPPVPAGWHMVWWQYADNENVPGIGVCDANVWLGGVPVAVPTATVIRTFGKEIPANVGIAQLASNLGLSRADLMAIPENARDFANYDDQASSVQGMQIRIPGYDPATVAAPQPPAQPSDADLMVAAIKKVFPNI